MEKLKQVGLFAWDTGIDVMFGLVTLYVWTEVDIEFKEILASVDNIIITLTKIATFAGVVLWVMKRYKQYKKI